MTKQEFYRELELLMEVDPDTIQGNETLDEIEGWDSLAVISFIAMADEKLQQSVSAAKLSECKTVPDLLNLLGDKING